MSSISQPNLQAQSSFHIDNHEPEGLSGAPKHKRVYQACIPCRRRKVKCDLGSVDNPGDPPCVRCRRESKECYFSATRRKRKVAGEEGADGSADGNEFDDEYITRNGRKRLDSEHIDSRRHTMDAPIASIGRYAQDTAYGPMTPGGHLGRTQPLRRPDDSSELRRRGDDANIRYENPEAEVVMRDEVYGPHDALNLLYKAASATDEAARANTSHFRQSPNVRVASPVHRRPGPRTTATNRSGRDSYVRSTSHANDGRIDPNLSSNLNEQLDRSQESGYKEAVKAWSRFRFVRAGWFTPAEAIDYLEYYYTFLSPLTPISPPTFSRPETHPTLLAEEPILSVTLLCIASRYKKMPGPGGHCRSHAIHDQLWSYLRGMVERCLWGQEAFGGGFCGSGAIDGEGSSSTAPWRGLRKGSLRTLGTVESLMILTEWHPRALHFPPADATDELMLPLYDAPDTASAQDDTTRAPSGGIGGKRIESWLEPAWRSDRMCWMLLSNAMGLSYELGVFDNVEELVAAGGETTRPEYGEEQYRQRAARIKKLLLIYVTQLAGRLGWTNMVPEALRNTKDPFEQRKRRSSIEGNTPGTSITSISNAFSYIPDLELDDQIIHCWAGITNAMRIGNERIFKTRKHTTDIIQTGTYITILKEFQPMLKNWWSTFEGFRLPQYSKHILTIEYEYVRIYINSLALQAVVERSTNNPAGMHSVPGQTQGNTANGNSILSPETQSFYGKMPLAQLGGFGLDDQIFVKEVVDGSRNLLSTVVDGLLPGGYLKHAPVRTYFRIISGAMFLLKTFALGASKLDVEKSIGLMDRAVDALRTCVVDDVHLGTRFADLLETLTSRLRNRFMHAASAPTAPHSARESPQPGREHGVTQDSQDPHTSNVREIRPSWTVGQSNKERDITDPSLSTPYTQEASDNPQNFYNPVSYNHPGSSAYELASDFNSGGFSDWQGGDMWYLPTGAAFFQNTDQVITQTADGVNIGGHDLLDFMTMDIGQGFDGVGGAGF